MHPVTEFTLVKAHSFIFMPEPSRRLEGRGQRAEPGQPGPDVRQVLVPGHRVLPRSRLVQMDGMINKQI